MPKYIFRDGRVSVSDDMYASASTIPQSESITQSIVLILITTHTSEIVEPNQQEKSDDQECSK